MPCVGFFAPVPYQEKQISAEPTIADNETLYECDSGRRISLDVGTRSVLIIGGTGSGKTRSVVLPMISNLIKNNLSGTIIDVKGNLRSQVRAIAAEHNRLEDVIEFGSHPSANKTNFISELDEYEVKELMNSFALENVSHDHNAHFFLHGAKIFYDIYKVLNDISKIHPDCHFSLQFKPTLEKIYEIANNLQLARGLWTFYTTSLSIMLQECKAEGKEPSQHLIDAETFVNQVKSDNFHVFKEQSSEFNNTYYEQLSFAINHINSSFNSLKVTHNLLSNFSSTSNNSIPFDFDKLIYQDNKIILIHFAIDSGTAGNILSKSIKEKFYQSIIKNGLNYQKKTFMIADEFQHIIDVSNKKRLNDMDFFSISREYNNINVVATQSISSLKSKGDSNSISSLIANCITKIILQCSDEQTNNWFKFLFSESNLCLKSLRKGECFIETIDCYNNITNRKETINKEYDKSKKIIDKYTDQTSKSIMSSPLPYRLGAGKFPRIISEILMINVPNQTKGRKVIFDYDNYAKNIYNKLDYIRDLSLRGIDYWSITNDNSDNFYSTQSNTQLELI